LHTVDLKLNNNGREMLPWHENVWHLIDRAVYQEVTSTQIFQRTLPIMPVAPKTMSVPFDSIGDPSAQIPGFYIDEGSVRSLIELSAPFILTQAQVEHETGNPQESGHSSAVTLATRAAAALTRATDLFTALGANALLNPLFTVSTPKVTAPPAKVFVRGFAVDLGMTNLPPDPGLPPSPQPPQQLQPLIDHVGVRLQTPGTPGVWGSNTFEAVVTAITNIENAGHTGPYAAVLALKPFTDLYRPVLGGSLAVTADVVRPLVNNTIFGMTDLPTGVKTGELGGADASYCGIVFSHSGGTSDIVVGQPPQTVVVQQLPDRAWLLRVVTRLIWRIMDTESINLLVFE
jgi:uncharacterized linocin/CFP29 family protein